MAAEALTLQAVRLMAAEALTLQVYTYYILT